MSHHLSRRDFVKSSVASAPVFLHGQGSNNKVTIGWIGTGSRGDYLIQRMYADNKNVAQVVAVCDASAANLARAKDRVATLGGHTPKTYADYQDLLADNSIDVVFISTPEHLHYSIFMAAIAAGKNIYLEKPLAHTIEQGFEMVAAADKAGKVVQVGTQNRSNSLYIKAKEMVAQGLIGEVHYVRAFDYSGGISHQTDITNFVCGKTTPLSCTASGGVALYEYKDKFHINYSCYFGNGHFVYGEQFMGNEGTIEVLNRSTLNFYGRQELSMNLPGNDHKAAEAHITNFLDAVRGKGQVIAPPSVGQQAAISSHMATLSLKAGKKIVWEEPASKYHFV